MISENSKISLKSQFKKTHGFRNNLKILLGGICCLVFILLIVLSIPVYAYRILVILLAKLFRPDLGDILNGLSSVLANDYFYNAKSPRSSIIVSLTMNGPDLSEQELKEAVLERWIREGDNKTGNFAFKKFQQYPVRWMGFTFWKNCQDTFDINNHVFCEQNVNVVLDDEKVNNICEKILNAPYPTKRSPWEVHLVKSYKNDKLSVTNCYSGDQTTCVVLIKVHHCLADGVSLINAIARLGENPSVNVKLPVPKLRKRSVQENITFYITFPFRAFYEFSYFVSHIFRSSLWKVPDCKKEWHQFCAESEFIPIQKVKFIKTQLKVSFTSVLLSAVSSSTQQSINNKKSKKFDEEPERIFKNCEDNSSMYCLTVLPLPGEFKCLTNHNSYALFDLPIDLNGSSVDRLHGVENMLELAKNASLPVLVPLYNSALGSNFYFVGKLLGTQRMIPAGLSNFPGMSTKIAMSNGAQCIAADFMAGGLDGVAGVGIMVLSYGDYIRVAVTAEKAVMSKEEINRFVKNVANEIDQLYRCCCANLCG